MTTKDDPDDDTHIDVGSKNEWMNSLCLSDHVTSHLVRVTQKPMSRVLLFAIRDDVAIKELQPLAENVHKLLLHLDIISEIFILSKLISGIKRTKIILITRNNFTLFNPFMFQLQKPFWNFNSKCNGHLPPLQSIWCFMDNEITEWIILLLIYYFYNINHYDIIYNNSSIIFIK